MRKAEIDGIDELLEPIALRRLQLPKMKTQCTEYEAKGMATKQIDLVLASAQMEEVAQDAHLELFGLCSDLEVQATIQRRASGRVRSR